MLTKDEPLKKSRHRRHLFGFVSEIGKDLFGFSTTKQVNHLNKRLNELTEMLQDQNSNYKATRDSIKRFESEVEGAFHAVAVKMDQASDRINLIADKLSNISHTLDDLTLFTSMLLPHILYSTEHRLNAHSYLSTIRQIFRGELPTSIFKRDLFRNCIIELTKDLEKATSRYHIPMSHHAISDLITNGKLSFTVVNDVIILDVKIPIRDVRPFNVFEWSPIPLYNHVDGYSQIKNLPYATMVSDDLTSYIDITEQQFSDCMQSNPDCMTLLESSTHVDPSCSIVLLLPEVAHGVPNPCKYDLFNDTITTFKRIGQDMFYRVGNAAQYSLVCDNTPTRVLHLNQSQLIKLPCGCSLMGSGDMVLLPFCDVSTKLEVVYIVNNLTREFFDLSVDNSLTVSNHSINISPLEKSNFTWPHSIQFEPDEMSYTPQHVLPDYSVDRSLLQSDHLVWYVIAASDAVILVIICLLAKKIHFIKSVLMLISMRLHKSEGRIEDGSDQNELMTLGVTTMYLCITIMGVACVYTLIRIAHRCKAIRRVSHTFYRHFQCCATPPLHSKYDGLLMRLNTRSKEFVVMLGVIPADKDVFITRLPECRHFSLSRGFPAENLNGMGE